eukprot:1497221-Rhodomonas_salina.1
MVTFRARGRVPQGGQYTKSSTELAYGPMWCARELVVLTLPRLWSYKGTNRRYGKSFYHWYSRPPIGLRMRSALSGTDIGYGCNAVLTLAVVLTDCGTDMGYGATIMKYWPRLLYYQNAVLT